MVRACLFSTNYLSLARARSLYPPIISPLATANKNISQPSALSGYLSRQTFSWRCDLTFDHGRSQLSVLLSADGVICRLMLGGVSSQELTLRGVLTPQQPTRLTAALVWRAQCVTNERAAISAAVDRAHAAMGQHGRLETAAHRLLGRAGIRAERRNTRSEHGRRTLR